MEDKDGRREKVRRVKIRRGRKKEGERWEVWGEQVVCRVKDFMSKVQVLESVLPSEIFVMEMCS